MRLIHGDCLAEMATIVDKSVDMILCDLPYGTTACKWDSVIPFEPLWAQYKRVIKDRGAIVLFGSQPFTTKLISSCIDLFKYELIWEKSKASNFVHARRMPLKAHENLSVFGFSVPYYPQMRKGEPYNRGKRSEKHSVQDVMNRIPNYHTHEIVNETGDRFPRSVMYFVTAESEGKFHPTQKPVPLLEYLIRTYTLEGETVLDNCMGSGSTGIACLNTGRNFIGIEKDDKYFAVASERISKHPPAELCA